MATSFCGRYRVVSLDGKLVETSGVMSAGGRTVKGLFGSQRGRGE